MPRSGVSAAAFLGVALGVAGAAPSGPAAYPSLPRGQVVERVACRGDPTKSYALYLPSGYSPDRRWPILIGFHPGARGRAIVDAYRDAAERYGLVVAGSNNSRIGPWDVSGRAANAMFQDIGQRFAIDDARIYLTGKTSWIYRRRSCCSPAAWSFTMAGLPG